MVNQRELECERERGREGEGGNNYIQTVLMYKSPHTSPLNGGNPRTLLWLLTPSTNSLRQNVTCYN